MQIGKYGVKFEQKKFHAFLNILISMKSIFVKLES